MDSTLLTLRAFNYFLALIGPFVVFFINQFIKNILDKKLVIITVKNRKVK